MQAKCGRKVFKGPSMCITSQTALARIAGLEYVRVRIWPKEDMLLSWEAWDLERTDKLLKLTM